MIPHELQSAIDAGLTRIESEDGNLPLGYRELIWAALGEHRVDPGRRRRARLAIDSARAAQRLRGEQFARDAFVDSILARAESSLSLPMSKHLQEIASDAWTELIEQPDAAMSGAAAAVAALLVVARDEAYAASYPDIARRDRATAESGDAAFFAAWAAAGGRVGQAGEDTSARREFWRWWLIVAAPAAFKSTSE